MKIFCENRNKFYKDENKATTFWGNNAAIFTPKEAKEKIDSLRSAIIDSDYLIIVEDNFKAYK